MISEKKIFEEDEFKQKCFHQWVAENFIKNLRKKMTNDDPDQYKFRIC